MLKAMCVTMQTARSITPKLTTPAYLGSRASVLSLHRAAGASKVAAVHPKVRQISVMSYPQAYPEPAPAARSNRVYTNFAVRSLNRCSPSRTIDV